MTKQYRFVKEVRADGQESYCTEEKIVLTHGTTYWTYVGGSMTVSEAAGQKIYKNLLDGQIVGKIVLHGEQGGENV